MSKHTGSIDAMRANARRLAKGIGRRVRRFAKQCRQRMSVDQRVPKTTVFICGCQRAGTSVLLELFEQSPEAFIYGEGQKPIFRGMRLGEESAVKRVIARNAARVIVVKPLCDSQWADRLLTDYERSRMIWAYRNLDDQVNSAVRKFSGQIVRMNKIKAGDFEGLDWRVERLSEESLGLIREFIHPEVSQVDAAALNWYIRTNLYFELQLNENPACQLLKYEDLVLHPEQTARRVFEFVGLPFDPKFVEILHPESVSKNVKPEIQPDIRRLCEGLLQRLDAEYQKCVVGEASLSPAAPV